MTRLGDLREGLRNRLATINGLASYATVMATPQTPAAAVVPRSREDLSFDGDCRYRFAIWVYVNPTDLKRAQEQIDRYLSSSGAHSIELAIEADPTLGGVAQNTSVTGWIEYATLVEGGDGSKLLGVRLDVEVLA